MPTEYVEIPACLRREEQEVMPHAHRCKWPGCTRQTPLKFCARKKHLALVPVELRKAILHAHQASQGGRREPDAEYRKAEEDVLAWIGRRESMEKPGQL